LRLSTWTAFKDVPLPGSQFWQQSSIQQLWQAISLRHICLGLPIETPNARNMVSKNVIEFLIDIILNFHGYIFQIAEGHQGPNAILSITHPAGHFKQFNMNGATFLPPRWQSRVKHEIVNAGV
jgi:hypothetical protein